MTTCIILEESSTITDDIVNTFNPKIHFIEKTKKKVCIKIYSIKL